MAAAELVPRTLPSVILSNEAGREALRAAHRRGEVERIRPGAYLPVSTGAPAWRRREQLALARVVAVSERLRASYVFSHATAALIHGLPLWRIDPACHVIQPYRPSTSRAPDLRRHVGALAPRDIVEINGLRVTGLARTVEDCALTMHPRDALVIADAALGARGGADRFRQEVTRPQVEEVRELLLERLERRAPTRGVARARAVITAADGFAESAQESAARWIALSRGLPPPTTQFRVETRLGTFYVDLTWYDVVNGYRLTAPVHAEIDGESKYSTDLTGTRSGPDVVRRAAEEASRRVFQEKRRQDAILELGGTMRHLVPQDLRDTDKAFTILMSGFPRAALSQLRPNFSLWPPRAAARGS